MSAQNMKEDIVLDIAECDPKSQSSSQWFSVSNKKILAALLFGLGAGAMGGMFLAESGHHRRLGRFRDDSSSDDNDVQTTIKSMRKKNEREWWSQDYNKQFYERRRAERLPAQNKEGKKEKTVLDETNKILVAAPEPITLVADAMPMPVEAAEVTPNMLTLIPRDANIMPECMYPDEELAPEETTPVASEEKPAPEETTPVASEEKPAPEETAPVASEAKPATNPAKEMKKKVDLSKYAPAYDQFHPFALSQRKPRWSEIHTRPQFPQSQKQTYPPVPDRSIEPENVSDESNSRWCGCCGC